MGGQAVDGLGFEGCMWQAEDHHLTGQYCIPPISGMAGFRIE